MTRLVALLLVVALVLAGIGVAALSVLEGSYGDPSPAPVPTTTPGPGATAPPSPVLARFYSQQLDWQACRSGALCAELEVPVDYQQPDGQTIELAVLKVPASDPDKRIGSVVVDPGGPGAPATDYARSASRVFRSEVTDAYDVVGLDPRGTGRSAPVDCLSDDDLDAYVAQDPDPDTPAEVDTFTGFVDELGRGCVERSGAVASHVTTVEAARDLDVLRAALGESELTYYGASYGTKLGATYADLFPARVGRMVLDGAVDVSLSSRELSLQQAAGFETALRAYVQDCVDGGDCVLGDSLEAGLARIRTFFEDVDAAPLPADGGRQLEVGNAFYGTVLPLYSRASWPALTQGLEQAFDGDGTRLLRYSDLYAGRGRNGYVDNSSEAFYAISCLDDPWAIPASQVVADLPDFEQASPTFGSVFAWGLTTCGGIEAKSTESPLDISAAGAAPIVVIGTTRDPATPYDWAVRLAEQLDSGVLVSRDGDGHTGYTEGNDCVDDAVDAYLVAGTVPDDGLSC
jgi:pimeloyl-ACP methyl ester carboxylesterase